MKIFLSAVSGQFKACRDALRSDLSAIGAEVVVQEDFQQHGASLLEKLERYIGSCDRIIALVGDAYGFEPVDRCARPDNRAALIPSGSISSPWASGSTGHVNRPRTFFSTSVHRNSSRCTRSRRRTTRRSCSRNSSRSCIEAERTETSLVCFTSCAPWYF